MPKPYVAVACLCERVLIEPDNVASLIRIIDTFTLQVAPGAALPEGVRPAIRLTIFISLKAGDAGPGELGIVLRRPNGQSEAAQKWPVVFGGGDTFGGPDQGANVKLDFTLAGEPGVLPDEGLYWFDVSWDGEMLTRIPLRLKLADSTAAPVLPSTP